MNISRGETLFIFWMKVNECRNQRDVPSKCKYQLPRSWFQSVCRGGRATRMTSKNPRTYRAWKIWRQTRPVDNCLEQLNWIHCLVGTNLLRYANLLCYISTKLRIEKITILLLYKQETQQKSDIQNIFRKSGYFWRKIAIFMLYDVLTMQRLGCFYWFGYVWIEEINTYLFYNN